MISSTSRQANKNHVEEIKPENDIFFEESNKICKKDECIVMNRKEIERVVGENNNSKCFENSKENKNTNTNLKSNVNNKIECEDIFSIKENTIDIFRRPRRISSIKAENQIKDFIKQEKEFILSDVTNNRKHKIIKKKIGKNVMLKNQENSNNIIKIKDNNKLKNSNNFENIKLIDNQIKVNKTLDNENILNSEIKDSITLEYEIKNENKNNEIIEKENIKNFESEFSGIRWNKDNKNKSENWQRIVNENQYIKKDNENNICEIKNELNNNLKNNLIEQENNKSSINELKNNKKSKEENTKKFFSDNFIFSKTKKSNKVSLRSIRYNKYLKKKKRNTNINSIYKTVMINRKSIINLFNCPKVIYNKLEKNKRVKFNLEDEKPCLIPHNNKSEINSILLKSEIDKEFQWNNEKEVINVIKRLDFGSEIFIEEFQFRRVEENTFGS